MGFLFGAPSAPPPPPPPAAAPQAANTGIAAAAAKETLASAEGQGSNGTDVTGGQGVKAPSTTKTLLGN